MKKRKLGILFFGAGILLLFIALYLIFLQPITKLTYRQKKTPFLFGDVTVAYDNGLHYYDIDGNRIRTVAVKSEREAANDNYVYCYGGKTLTAFDKNGERKFQTKTKIKADALRVDAKNVYVIGEKQAEVYNEKLEKVSTMKDNTYFVGAVKAGDAFWYTSIGARDGRMFSRIFLKDKKDKLLYKQTFYDETIQFVGAFDNGKVILVSDQNIYLMNGIQIEERIEIEQLTDCAMNGEQFALLSRQKIYWYDDSLKELNQKKLKEPVRILFTDNNCILYNNHGYSFLEDDVPFTETGIMDMIKYKNFLYIWDGKVLTRIGG